jgi:pyrimidine deaminase RibD-like protein
MARAIELARSAKRICKPNPAVGAVLVRDGLVVGEGHTQPVGQAHAEIMALAEAGERAHGAALYVSLEPCSHVGRTAPCVDALIAAGVAEIHASMVDPSPWVSGRGLQRAREAGIAVILGERDAEAREINAAYFTWVQHGRPLVTAILQGSSKPMRDLPGVQSSCTLSRTALHSIYEEADRVVVDPSGRVDDVDRWVLALSSLAGLSVQHVVIETEEATIAELARRGMVDRVGFVSPARETQGDRDELLGARRSAVTLQGLVACSAGS